MTPDEIVAARLVLYEERAAAGLPTCGPGEADAGSLHGRVQCDACGKLAASKWARSQGWKRRQLPGYVGVDETYCPECFAKWGWGSRARTYYHPWAGNNAY